MGAAFAATLRTGCVTALVFASAALLALALIGPRFAAKVPISFANGTLSEPAEWLSEFQTQAFRSALGARLSAERGWLGEAAPLSRRLRALLGIDDPAEDRGEVDLLSRLTIEADPLGSTLTIRGEAAGPDDAKVLAKSAAEELSRRMGTRRMSGSVSADEERAAAEEAVAALRLRAPNAVEAQAAPLVEQRAALSAEEGEVRERREAVSARLDRLRALEADPSADPAADVSATPTLRDLLERYRALATSIDALNETLPDQSPRLRIARLHLRELADRIGMEAASLVPGLEEDVRILDERGQALSGDIAALDQELSALRLQEREAEDHAARLAAAEARLVALDTARAEGAAEPVAIVGDVSPALTIPPPFLQVSLLAAFAGFVVGAAGRAAKRFAGRRLGAPIEEGALPWGGAEIDERPEDFVPAASEPSLIAGEDREEITVEEAVAGLSASPISRTLVASFGEPVGPVASLQLARALARDGQLVLLIDLSSAQAATVEAGMPTGSKGFGDVVSGSHTLPSVTFGDEGSGTDLVSIGRAGGEPSARNEALRFARRAYDQVVVDCGTLPAKELLSLADENAAVLLASSAAGNTPALAERLRDFQAAGLDVAILLV